MSPHKYTLISNENGKPIRKEGTQSHVPKGCHISDMQWLTGYRIA